MKKLTIQGTKVKLVLYIQNLNLICEVYVDNKFVEKFIYSIVELLKLVK